MNAHATSMRMQRLNSALPCSFFTLSLLLLFSLGLDKCSGQPKPVSRRLLAAISGAIYVTISSVICCSSF